MMEESFTLGQILEHGKSFLESKGVPDADLDAWYLMEQIWQIDRSFYYAHKNDAVHKDKQKEQRKQYERCLLRRGEREPLQHILGYAYFMELKFLVNAQVLIPRPDTEILAEEARKQLYPGDRVLDLCTGSGCILLSLLYACPKTKGTGADISREALEVARENSRRLKLPADFIQSDLFENITGRFQMIVSNPPYIPSDGIESLMEEVRRYDPRLALDGGADGLDFYRRLLKESPEYLTPGGALLLEIGSDQGAWVQAQMKEQGYRKVQIIKDLSGLDRVVLGYVPEERGENHV